MAAEAFAMKKSLAYMDLERGKGDGGGKLAPTGPHAPSRSWILSALLACFLFPLLRPNAEESPGTAQRFADYYREAFQKAMEQWRKDPAEVEAGWKLGKAAFDWAEFARNKEEREERAEIGITACKAALKQDARSVEAHYYLGMNQGQLARTKLLGGLKLVRQMETHFLKCLELNEKYDRGGAHRCLGLLYRDAPGWPASIGDHDKAKRHLRKAVSLCPEYPGNHIQLLESCLKMKEEKAFLQAYPAAADAIEKARNHFTGQKWASSWAEWNADWAELKKAYLEKTQ